MSYCPKHSPENWYLGVTITFLIHMTVCFSILWLPDFLNTTHLDSQVIEVKFLTPSIKNKPLPENLSPTPGPQNNQNINKKIKTDKTTKSKILNQPKELKKTTKTTKSAHKKAITSKPVPVKTQVKEKKVHKTAPVKTKQKTVKTKPSPEKDEETLEKRLAAMKAKVDENQHKEAILDKKLKALSGKVNKKGSREVFPVNGDGVSSNQYAANIYGGVLKNRIRTRWFYPSTLFQTNGLRVTISLKISSKGELISAKFEKKSGNPMYDNSVMRAVKAAAPFPPIPSELQPGPWEAGFNFDIEEM